MSSSKKARRIEEWKRDLAGVWTRFDRKTQQTITWQGAAPNNVITIEERQLSRNQLQNTPRVPLQAPSPVKWNEITRTHRVSSKFAEKLLTPKIRADCGPGLEKHAVRARIDTRAVTSRISTSRLQKWGFPWVRYPYQHSIQTENNERVPILGVVGLLWLHSNKWKYTQFYVTNGENTDILLGRNAVCEPVNNSAAGLGHSIHRNVPREEDLAAYFRWQIFINHPSSGQAIETYAIQDSWMTLDTISFDAVMGHGLRNLMKYLPEPHHMINMNGTILSVSSYVDLHWGIAALHPEPWKESPTRFYVLEGQNADFVFGKKITCALQAVRNERGQTLNQATRDGGRVHSPVMNWAWRDFEPNKTIYNRQIVR
jgi:hypothetical protein